MKYTDNVRHAWLVGLLFIAAPLQAQKVIDFSEPRSGVIQLTPQISVPVENAGYTLVLPGDASGGLIVFFNSGRDTSQASEFLHLARKANLAVAYVTTGNPLDFFFEDQAMHQIDHYLNTILTEHSIPRDHLFFCGMSLAGTRALKYSIFCARGKSAAKLMPAAVAICDAPLDFIRFWKSGRKAAALNFEPSAANEGTWTSSYLEKNLGGTPGEKPEAYVDYSPYTHDAPDGGNCKYLKNIAIRAYTEPDVGWWIKNRRKDYYDMNAIDAAALINQLYLLGNRKSKLITTSDKGRRPNGQRHPHSWSIVDQESLINWFKTKIR